MEAHERIKRKRGIKCADIYLSEMIDPKFCKSTDEFKQASYARSAILYLRKQFKEDPSRTPRQLTLLFIDSMNRKKGIRYSVAYDTAVDFFDRFFML